MTVDGFADLRRHVGHDIACVGYGDLPMNVAVECETCGEVLMDYDRPDEWVQATFHPQEWMTVLGGDEQAIPAEGHEPTTFEVPLKDATHDGGLVRDDSWRSDRLKDHSCAPKWVREWEGPFYIEVERAFLGGGGE